MHRVAGMPTTASRHFKQERLWSRAVVQVSRWRCPDPPRGSKRSPAVAAPRTTITGRSGCSWWIR